ncbi:hypothetical protein AMJ39_09710 [candidate division TA06 bacterium DG_24]|jgi:hypothetical protein|uniref:Uncharacterized protein n=3 Tax=Bacteria division TA06 TaxID=1156500 RepID=A0A0S8J9Z5_UNCT6|nr:MAG: hypothetical protein AMJ39_09710 [candidate division TA06 bacterium DG_24]KPK68460.1 MAG: hypothetical protein AMJ82_08180 [candidate division TA06 bacterium SM23_40]KPL06320.1 MAG: hypothetical protein AMJ71_10030 [candidate division TA06 bacterium SM1_40]
MLIDECSQLAVEAVKTGEMRGSTGVTREEQMRAYQHNMTRKSQKVKAVPTEKRPKKRAARRPDF